MKENIIIVLVLILWLSFGIIGTGMQTYYEYSNYSMTFSNSFFIRCCSILSGPLPLAGLGAAYLGDWADDEEIIIGFESPFKIYK